MRTGPWMAGMMTLSIVFGAAIDADEQQRPPFQIPANVRLLHDIELAIRSIHARSPLFRLQLARIADAPHLRVTIQIDPSIRSICRAFTIVQRRGHRIRAEVHVPPSSDHAELLAHELEHVLEQIEGIDLRGLARIRDSGVYALDYAVFETDRAQAAGRAVLAETRRNASPEAD